MTFKGFSKKHAGLVIMIYITIAIIVQFAVNFKYSMYMVGFGMFISGLFGIKNASYAIFKKEEAVGDSKMSGFMTYMNYLLVFLGIIVFLQQY